MNTNLTRIGVGLVSLMALLAMVPAGNALAALDYKGAIDKVYAPERCTESDNHVPGGSWSKDCTGVRNGCVGTWSTRGTHDVNRTHITLYSHSDTTCVYDFVDITADSQASSAALDLGVVFETVEDHIHAEDSNAAALNLEGAIGAVNVPERCTSSDNHFVGGSWSRDCTGVRNGCVGTWSTRGVHDAQLRHVTTYSYSDTTCLYTLIGALAATN